MKLEQLQEKLLAAARAQPPSDRVPYAFEKRIMARLPAEAVADGGDLWARSLWRAAAPCVAISMALSAWTLFAPAPESGADDFAQVFEQTMMATLDSSEEAW